MGQGSIFDMGGDSEEAVKGGQHAPISETEFEQKELLSLEKETLGTFLSSHPLDGLREAILASSDCGLDELRQRDDGSWVKVGGIITEYRKMRTKSGSQMAFATLSDIESEVELIVFRAGESEKLAAIQPDSVVLVKGRVDQTEKGTKIVAQEAVEFDPGPEEIARAVEQQKKKKEPFTVKVESARLSLDALEEIKSVFEHHKGEADVHLVVVNGDRERRLKLGPDYRVRRSPGLSIELEEILGSGTARAA